jgi:methyl-accepting chemotaxis protein
MQTIPKNYLNGFVAKSTLVFATVAFLTTAALSLAPPERVLSYADSFRLISELNRALIVKSLTIFSLAFLFMLMGIIILSLVYSHRVAGALHKLGMHLRDIASGDLSQTVRLRNSDVIHELAADLNDFSSLHSGLLMRINLRTRELETALKIANHPGVPRREAVREISERIDEIRNLLSQIRP